MPKALIVTITEGVELQPQAAFLSSALRVLGFQTELLPTDFCTTQDSFQTAVRAASPDAVVFVDALEWREILAMLSGFAVEATPSPVLIATALPTIPKPSGFEERVRFASNGDGNALASALGIEGGPIDLARCGLDYGLFGAAALAGRAMGCSLFGEVGTFPILTRRTLPHGSSPTAAIARLEGVVGGAQPVDLTREAVLEPLTALGSAVVAVESWNRGDTGDLVERAKASIGGPRSIRLLPGSADRDFLPMLKERGVTRVVFDCDALEDSADVRIPGAAASAAELAVWVLDAKRTGFEVGVLLVIGLPGETAMHTKARCDILRKAGIDRVRVVPFEPAGGTAAYGWCVDRGLWPPKDNRWNRELYQPLEQPQKSEWPRILEEALMLVADVEARAGAPS